MKPNTTSKPLLLLTLLATTSTHVLAQERVNPVVFPKVRVIKNRPRGSETFESPQRIRARAIAVELAGDAVRWEDKRASVWALAQTADLVWADDPERSRNWLKRAWDLADQLEVEEASNSARLFRSNSARVRARASVLTVAQKHDPRFAESLLERLAEEKESSHADSRRGIFDDRSTRSEQLLNLALATVDSDPAVAVDLARRSLNDGVSFQLQTLLLALRQGDGAMADRLFDAALDRLEKGFSHPSEGQVLASYLFTPGRVAAAGGGGSALTLAVGARTPAPAQTPAEADPARARRFLNVMQRALLSMPAPTLTPAPAQSALEFVTLARTLAGAYKTYAPHLWLPIEQRLAQVIPDLAPAQVNTRTPASVRDKLASAGAAGASDKELNELYVDGLEEVAEKERDPIARRLAFAHAAMATAPENLERGRGLAAKIGDEELRAQVVSQLVYRNALLALERGKVEEAVRLAAETRSVQRTIILITAAQRVGARHPGEEEAQAAGRMLVALGYLSDAEKLLTRDDASAEALRVRLGFIAALAPLDSPRALKAFDDVVSAINKSGSFNALDTGAPRIVGWDNLGLQSSLPRIRTGYGLKDVVTLLARYDLEEVKRVSDKLSEPAVRGTCWLEIARSILSDGVDK
jgi:hypothetical protein